MARSDSPPVTWAHAAEALAARVRRRAVWGSAFTRIGYALVVAAALALLWRALGPTTLLSGRGDVLLILGAGLLTGIVLARRAGAVGGKIGSADAAWALDRLADAGGRGLAAASARGAAASEAAFAGTPLGAPPSVRLHPPRGLTLIAGGCLLAVLAFLAPERTAEADTAPAGPSAASAGGEAAPGAAAASAEGKAGALQAKADAAQRVRKALNLPADGPLDPKDVAAKLADPEARRKAAAAAGEGSPLADLLNRSETPGDAVARAIGRGEDNQADASQTRREAAGARARLGLPGVPAARRDVVKRYLDSIADESR